MELLVNPPKSRRRKKRRTAAQRRATAKMIAAGRRKRRSARKTTGRRRSPATSTARKRRTKGTTTMARKRRRSTTRRRRRNSSSSAGVARMRGFFAVPKLEPTLWTGAGFVAAGILPRYVPGIPQNSTAMRLAVKTGTAALAGGIVGKTIGRRQGQYVALGGAVAVAAEVIASVMAKAGVQGMGEVVATPGLPDLDGMGAVYLPIEGYGDTDDAILADALEGTYLPIG